MSRDTPDTEYENSSTIQFNAIAKQANAPALSMIAVLHLLMELSRSSMMSPVVGGLELKSSTAITKYSSSSSSSHTNPNTWVWPWMNFSDAGGRKR